jgi:hypothetical protein
MDYMCRYCGPYLYDFHVNEINVINEPLFTGNAWLGYNISANSMRLINKGIWAPNNYIGGITAHNLDIQIIGDPAFSTLTGSIMGLSADSLNIIANNQSMAVRYVTAAELNMVGGNVMISNADIRRANLNLGTCTLVMATISCLNGYANGISLGSGFYGLGNMFFMGSSTTNGAMTYPLNHF